MAEMILLEPEAGKKICREGRYGNDHDGMKANNIVVFVHRAKSQSFSGGKPHTAIFAPAG